MKTKELGEVLGISKQRNWWNRQTDRRSTEELAAQNITWNSRQKQSSRRVNRTMRPSRKLRSKKNMNLMRVKGVVTEIYWRTGFNEASQLRKYTVRSHRLEMAFGTQKLVQVTIQSAPIDKRPTAICMLTFFLPAKLARLTRLGRGQNVNVGLRYIKLESGRGISICESLAFAAAT